MQLLTENPELKMSDVCVWAFRGGSFLFLSSFSQRNHILVNMKLTLCLKSVPDISQMLEDTAMFSITEELYCGSIIAYSGCPINVS